MKLIDNVKLGKTAEKAAVKYLKKSGYIILDRNIISNAGEIDIVAQYDGIIIFIEVKYRSGEEFGSPAEAVDYYKIRRYVNSAKLYIVKNKLANRDIRFDVVEVNDKLINHIIDAFRA